MSEKGDLRRHRRVSWSGAIELSWLGANGQPHFVRGRCLDVSESGLRIEAPEPVPVRAHVNFRIGSINVSGSASVRHCTRRGNKFVLGVELSAGTNLKHRIDALEQQGDPAALPAKDKMPN